MTLEATNNSENDVFKGFSYTKDDPFGSDEINGEFNTDSSVDVNKGDGKEGSEKLYSDENLYLSFEDRVLE